jgi:hypothetical protein
MTNPILLKWFIGAMILAFMIMAVVLWLKTPNLFEYFNQAFCAH